jgi:RNA polymerase sigma factor (TIGR02999 family)
VVHEAYLKIFGRGQVALKDRAHFFGVVCLAMRQVLRDHARRRLARKRGGGQAPLDLELHDGAVEQDLATFLELDQALQRLAAASPRLAEVVQLRYFAGLSVQEVAQLQGVTERTVLRDWRKARAFLMTQLDAEDPATG